VVLCYTALFNWPAFSELLKIKSNLVARSEFWTLYSSTSWPAVAPVTHQQDKRQKPKSLIVKGCVLDVLASLHHFTHVHTNYTFFYKAYAR